MKRILKAGGGGVSIPLYIYNSSSTVGAGLGGLVYNTAGLEAKYRRAGQNAWTTIVLAAGVLGTWSSGGWVADGITGAYELGLPNAAVAPGASAVYLQIYGAANMIPVLVEIELVAYDPDNGTSLGLGAIDAIEDRVTISLPNGVAPGEAGGLPLVDADGAVKLPDPAPDGYGGGGSGAGGSVNAYLSGKLGTLGSPGCGCGCRSSCGSCGGGSRPFRLYRGDTRAYPVFLEGAASSIFSLPVGVSAQLWNDLGQLPDPAFTVDDPNRLYGMVQMNQAYWEDEAMVGRGNYYLRIVDADENILTQIPMIVGVKTPGEE